MGDIANLDDARRDAEEKEKTRIAKMMVKKEVRAQEAAKIMEQNLKIKQADKRAKSQLMAGGSYEDLLSEKQASNKLALELKDQISGGALGFDVAIGEDEDGMRFPLLVNGAGEVKMTHKDKITSGIFNYTELLSKDDIRYLWAVSDSDSIYSMWQKSGEPVEIKKYAWKSETGLSFRRLPFDFDESGRYAHPTWDLVLASIISDQSTSDQDQIEKASQPKDHFMHYIGSIFEPRSPCQNYLWMFGDGRNAKGSILRCLKSLMGRAAKRQDAPNDQNKRFWTNSLRGARLCYLPDVTDMGFVKTGFWRSLTGGDEINVERKGGSFYDMANDIKMIVDSNERPNISSKRADMRRVIFIEFGEMAEIDCFEDKLKAEMPAFISHCLHSYRATYAPHFPAMRGEMQTSVQDMASDSDAFHEHFFEQHFAAGGICRSSEFAGAIDGLTARRQADFRHWVKKRFAITKLSVSSERIDGVENPVKYRYYDGFSLKPVNILGFKGFKAGLGNE